MEDAASNHQLIGRPFTSPKEGTDVKREAAHQRLGTSNSLGHAVSPTNGNVHSTVDLPIHKSVNSRLPPLGGDGEVLKGNNETMGTVAPARTSTFQPLQPLEPLKTEVVTSSLNSTYNEIRPAHYDRRRRPSSAQGPLTELAAHRVNKAAICMCHVKPSVNGTGCQ
jgi:hypothetical protein